ncbi:MAG: hypothetical protein WA666_02265 [Nitrospirota bacterium]
MKSPTAAFQAAMNKSGNSPRTLLVFNFPSPTGPVYVSDGPWNTGVNSYLPLVMSWQPIYKQVNPDPLTFDTTDWNLTLGNTGATPFSAYFAMYEPLSVQVDVYHWFDGLADSDKLLIDSLIVLEVTSYDPEKIELDLISLIEKYENYLSQAAPIDTTNWPFAEPAAIGKLEPVIYGTISNLLCPCVRGGSLGKLMSPITASQLYIDVSWAPNVLQPPAAPWTAICMGEWLRVTSNRGAASVVVGSDGNRYTCILGHVSSAATKPVTGANYAQYWQLGGTGGSAWAAGAQYMSVNTIAVTRTYNGVMPLGAQNAGAEFIEYRTDIKYIVSGRRIQGVPNVYIDGIKVPPYYYTINYNDNGKTTLMFTQQFFIQQATALSLYDGGHSHGAGGGSSNWYPSSASTNTGSGGFTQTGILGSSYDGNNSTAFEVQQTNAAASGYVQWNFPAWAGGTPSGVYVCFYGWANAGGGYQGNATINGNTIAQSGAPQLFKYYIGTAVPSSVSLNIPIAGANGDNTVYICEVYLEVDAGQTTTNATGVGLSGGGASEYLVGKAVTADVKGNIDDANGTYTGTPNALIQNPVHVLHHFIENYGAPAGSCDSVSFAAAASACSAAISGGYLFAFALTKQVSFKTTVARLAFQCRTRIWMEATSFRAVFRSLPPPASVLSVGTAMMGFRSVKVSLTTKDEIVNDMKLSYNPDWSKGEPSASNCLSICNQSANYPLGGDPTSVSWAGIRRNTQWELMEFVYLSAMVSDLRDFYLMMYKARRIRIDWTGFSQVVAVERFDPLALNHNAPAFKFNQLLTETENVKYYPGSGRGKRAHRVEITGVTYPGHYMTAVPDEAVPDEAIPG